MKDINQGLLPIDDAADRWVDQTLGTLSLDQKIGQLMVFAHYGTFSTPDVKELIQHYHVGGLRISQKFAPGCSDLPNIGHADPVQNGTFLRPDDLRRISCTAAEFASALNTLREIALERPGQVPLHTAFDQEGEGADFLFEQRLFPYPMGLAASGDPDLARRVSCAIGRQARAVGGNMIHSPVLDVNTDPANPEIGTRAYGEDADTVTRYARASLQGFTEAGIAATGKHFPGRGHSNCDAHFGLPVIELDRETLYRKHLAPYKALIAQGLPCIMAAFTAYPALSGKAVPAAISPEIMTGILREEFGFQGVVTSDNIQMNGLLDQFDHDMGEAAVACLSAGCDLILCRAYDHRRLQVLESVKKAVRDGRYPESKVDASVARILRLRWQLGLVPDGGLVSPEQAGRLFTDTDMIALAHEAADRSITLLRDRAELLPLSSGSKILFIEQIHHFHSFINNTYIHPGMVWEELTRLMPEIKAVAVKEKMTEEDEATALRHAEDADVLISTSYYNYRSGACMLPFLEKLRSTGKPLIVLSNTPYEKFGVPDWVDTALVSFCASGREHARAAAELLAGKRSATAIWKSANG